MYVGVRVRRGDIPNARAVGKGPRQERDGATADAEFRIGHAPARKDRDDDKGGSSWISEADLTLVSSVNMRLGRWATWLNHAPTQRQQHCF